MCDSPNTTDIVETECYLCPTQELCNEFRHSYVNRCKWKVILGRQNEDGDMDGICTDGLDYIAAGFSPGVATIGWLIFLFGIGWLRKDRGKFALLLNAQGRTGYVLDTKWPTHPARGVCGARAHAWRVGAAREAVVLAWSSRRTTARVK